MVPRIGLSREPFIAGIYMMIDRLVVEITDAHRRFCAVLAPPRSGRTKKSSEAGRIRRELIMQRSVQDGRRGLPGVAKIFRSGSGSNLRPPGAEELTGESLLDDALL